MQDQKGNESERGFTDEWWALWKFFILFYQFTLGIMIVMVSMRCMPVSSFITLIGLDLFLA